ncbi:MAG TPA: phosphoribosyltransferase [Bacteroidales bacterium]|nr:phosphoribosyltransferase [Bacteroidales bacterium]
MNITFEKKFSEKQLDDFVNSIYNNVLTNPNDKYYFDLSKTEWMSNQGLLIFTSILKYFLETKTDFEVTFFKKGTPTTQVPRRVAVQIIQIWEVWGLWKIFDINKCEKYLGITYSTIESLKNIYKKEGFHRAQIYDMYGITPFVALDKIINYDDNSIIEELNGYHTLNDATKEIVKIYNCEHPFVNGVFGNIISKELYENFLDHFNKSFFSSDNEFAFMSVAIKGELNEEKAEKEGYRIQDILENNFKTEEIDESIDFFYDKENKKYKNLSYITYSFLDFGEGICNTLRSEFQKSNTDISDDSKILRFAFKHNSSRHQVQNPFYFNKLEEFIPRGLFDVICLVQRYNGLLIARSCNGRILYDFSKTKKINEAYKSFGDKRLYFPGTFITIYLPAIINSQNLDYSVFEPDLEIPTYKRTNKNILSIHEIIKHAGLITKEDRYNQLFSDFNKLLPKNIPLLNLISLKYVDDHQLLKKILFYLTTNHNVNLNNCFLLFYPPSKSFLEEINYELSNLSALDKSYKIHPLPLVYINNKDESEVFWLGIYNESDKLKLNELLGDVFSIAKQDFITPDSIKGHFNDFDNFGNLTSKFPSIDEIHSYIGYFEVKELVNSDKYISQEKGHVYLCNGNYYQHEFYEMVKMLNDRYLCKIVSRLLYENIENKLSEFKIPRKRKYIAITSSSHMIADSLLDQNLIHSPTEVIYLDNYHIKNIESKLPTNATDFDFILLCDVLSTGAVACRLMNNLKEFGGELKCISIIINAVHEDNFETINDYKSIKDKIVQIHSYPIKKYYRDNKSGKINPAIEESIKNNKIIRINPYTNVPITFSIEETNPENIILSNIEFLDLINENNIRIGPFVFNNLLHPYFFKTRDILKESGIKLFEKIFTTKKLIRGRKCSLIELIDTNGLNIFYPKKSDIENLDFVKFKQKVLKSERGIGNYKLERYPTEEGWRFPHTTDYFNEIVRGNQVLILDDGSCTGASLKQMINDVAYFIPKKITLVCLIGRVSEHKREFLTSISQIVKGSNTIEVEIFFGSYWHIPTYFIDDNPNIKERIWLSRILKLPNLPTEINKVANEINYILIPKDEEYKYFPRKDGNIPKKEIIKVRDEIGKIIGYLFYKESFNYFNEFIKLYSFREEKEDRYKTIELICAVIAYEPHVFERLKNIMPDVVEKLVEFIDVLIFKSPRNLSNSPLTYNWNIRDIFHLFFILNEEEQIYNKLKEGSKFSNFVKFINLNDTTSFNYLLFRVLRYFPLELSDLQRNIDRKFLVLLNKFKKSSEFSSETRRMIKVFISFIHTLPKNRSFENQLLLLNRNFESIENDKSHLNNISANLGFMLSDITTRLKNYDESALIKFKKSWQVAANFIEPLLSFYSSFPNFFPSKISNQVEEISLIFKRLNQRIILNINDSNLTNIQSDLKILQSEYFNCNTDLFRLFIQPTTSELKAKLSEKIIEFNRTEIGTNRYIELKGEMDANIFIDFPDFYFSDIILNTLFNNFRHSAEKEKITIYIKPEKVHNIFSMEIYNTISEEIDSGGGNGISKLLEAKKYPNNIFDYQFKSIGTTFYQVVRIKLL